MSEKILNNQDYDDGMEEFMLEYYKNIPSDEELKKEYSESVRDNDNFHPIDETYPKDITFPQDNKKQCKIQILKEDTEEILELKKLLNICIADIDIKEWGCWDDINSSLNNNNHLDMKAIPKKTYLIGMNKIMNIFSNKYNWNFAKDGNILYLYNNEYWMEIDSSLIKSFLKVVAEQLFIPEILYGDYTFIENIFKQLNNGDFFKQMIFPDETLINLQNGTLLIDSRGIKLLEFQPEDFLTYQLDFKYDNSKENHIFLKFLNDILPDRSTQRTLQQGLASLFIPFLKLEKVLFLYGTGGNGKSVIFEILKGILNSNLMTYYSLESLVAGGSYERCELNNKLINYGSDINMKNINHGVFKQLVSGEPINVRQIYEKPFVMKRYAKMIFNVNKIDNADIENTIGFFRRMIFIPFEKTISENKQDKNLHKKILRNKAGILNWIVEGIYDVLDTESIFVSKKCTDFLDNFSKESNIAARFVEEYSIVHSDSHTVSFQILYNKFISFCKDEGERPMPKRLFNKEFKNLNFVEKRRSQGYVWLVTIT